jgi:hypothetical protein
MYGLANRRSVEHVMSELMGCRESLSVRVVKRIHTDDAYAVLYVGHP